MNRPIEELLKYGGAAVDEALGRTEAFFQRQQQHERYGAPLAHRRTPVFSVQRSEQPDTLRRLIAAEMERVKQQRALAGLYAQSAAAPAIPELAELLHRGTAPDVLEAAAAKPPRKIRKDFFGRPIAADDDAGTAAAGGHNRQQHGRELPPSVKYKFQEGFTNAVKRKLTLAYFL